ncbi:ATP adenylyltransferase [cyanobacterium endosymbiont of Rhopalodia gibberula]|uniref:ATP adenylyltransferase family protein n=1 Tax=cyanobacterium endosymbiont of Rhopalodia gibberula TaxID=1763363 RepID=UPI000DC6F392|nr:phosphorylase [cyanobacterium endosymbiont of Rhopalodia gibberula]BBA80237.1 ATP adenylyltransferase [cyanobacterium endosymbiont of Rhopalodia gibberula]
MATSMNLDKEEFESTDLWEKVITQTNHAINCGALQSIVTNYAFIKDANIRFLVKILDNFLQKEISQKKETQQRKKIEEKVDPFLPYEEDLFVTNLSDTHVCLLNKYNVFDYHLLITTRVFEEQQSWLDLNDFAALGQCLLQIDGLGFYNSGTLSGASQQHKHLQLVPFPLSSEVEKIPIESIIKEIDFQEDIGFVSSFNFSHALIKINLTTGKNYFQNALIFLENYHKLLMAINLPLNKEKPTVDYNLLITREWMMIIERSQASYKSIPVNALGFAGTFFVKNQKQMEQLKELTPLIILQNVAKNKK